MEEAKPNRTLTSNDYGFVNNLLEDNVSFSKVQAALMESGLSFEDAAKVLEAGMTERREAMFEKSKQQMMLGLICFLLSLLLSIIFPNWIFFGIIFLGIALTYRGYSSYKISKVMLEE